MKIDTVRKCFKKCLTEIINMVSHFVKLQNGAYTLFKLNQNFNVQTEEF